jgi:hypothetical protein
LYFVKHRNVYRYFCISINSETNGVLFNVCFVFFVISAIFELRKKVKSIIDTSVYEEINV